MDRMRLTAVVLIIALIFSVAGSALVIMQKDDVQKERNGETAKVEMQATLSEVQVKVWAEFRSVSENLTAASALLKTTGLNGTAARAVLSGLFANVSYGVDVITINASGVAVAAMPSKYVSIEGKDISNQSQVQRMLSTKMPVMSDVFVMAEGFTAADIEVPVFTASGTFNGSVSVALDLESLFHDIVAQSVDLSKYQFTCLQTDGMEVYDTDEAQIGRNLFTDPAYQNYTDVLQFMHGLLSQDHGYGNYQYYKTLASQELVKKEVYWTSVGMYGVEWRILMIHAI